MLDKQLNMLVAIYGKRTINFEKQKFYLDPQLN